MLHDPQAGTPGLLNVPYRTFAGADPQAGAPARLVRSSLSSPRDKNLCIIRARNSLTPQQGLQVEQAFGDTVQAVDKDLVTELIKAAKKYPKAGALSPKIYFAKGYEFHKDRYKESELGKVIWYAGGDIDWNNVYGKTRGVDEVDKGQFDKTGETDFVTGTCTLLRRKTLEDTGFFDKKYFMYYEDTDLSQRMKKKGWKILYVPKAKLWHKVAQSSGIGSNLNDYFTTRNRLLFGLRYAKFRAKLALVKESIKFLFTGRKWQKIGARDFYLGRFGKGSWK